MFQYLVLYSLFCTIDSASEVEHSIEGEAKSIRGGVRVARFVAISSDESSGCRDEEETTMKTTTTVKTTTARVIILPRGPFYDFLVDICKTLLLKFLPRKIPSYFIVLSKSLKELGSEYLIRSLIKKFCSRLRDLSVYNGILLKDRVQMFLDTISSGDPKMNEFFYAMNSIFGITAANKMDDYVYDVMKYGKDRKRHIGDRTRQVFKELIFYTFYKQSDDVRNLIELKFNLAVIEYMQKNKKSPSEF